MQVRSPSFSESNHLVDSKQAQELMNLPHQGFSDLLVAGCSSVQLLQFSVEVAQDLLLDDRPVEMGRRQLLLEACEPKSQTRAVELQPKQVELLLQQLFQQTWGLASLRLQAARTPLAA